MPETEYEKMRIAVIAHPLHSGGGISVAQNMIAALGRIAPQHEYFISIPSNLGYEDVVAAIPNNSNVVYSGRSNLIQRWRFEQYKLIPMLRRFSPDLMLALANKGISGIACPQAILCHNPYLWHSKQNYGHYSPLGMAYICLKTKIQRLCLKRDLENSRNILLYQTQSARGCISRIFSLKASSTYCPNAVSKYAIESQDKYLIPEPIKPYIGRFKVFYLTRYYPHKNLEAIVEVFIRNRVELNDVTAFITIDSEQDSGARKLLKSIKRYGLENHVVNVGPIPQASLASYYNFCDALLMPTLLESFSGTYLEAMHFGLPILTSDLDFAHDICGEAAMYFNPWSAASICSAILSLKKNPEIAQSLRLKGIERINKMGMSWDRIASEVLSQLYPAVENSKTPVNI